VNALRTTAAVRVKFGTPLPGFTRLFLAKIITVAADKRYWLIGQFVALTLRECFAGRSLGSLATHHRDAADAATYDFRCKFHPTPRNGKVDIK